MTHDTRAVLIGVMCGFPVLAGFYLIAWLIGAVAYMVGVL